MLRGVDKKKEKKDLYELWFENKGNIDWCKDSSTYGLLQRHSAPNYCAPFMFLHLFVESSCNVLITFILQELTDICLSFEPGLYFGLDQQYPT